MPTPSHFNASANDASTASSKDDEEEEEEEEVARAVRRRPSYASTLTSVSANRIKDSTCVVCSLAPLCSSSSSSSSASAQCPSTARMFLASARNGVDFGGEVASTGHASSSSRRIRVVASSSASNGMASSRCVVCFDSLDGWIDVTSTKLQSSSNKSHGRDDDKL